MCKPPNGIYETFKKHKKGFRDLYVREKIETLGENDLRFIRRCFHVLHKGPHMTGIKERIQSSGRRPLRDATIRVKSGEYLTKFRVHHVSL